MSNKLDFKKGYILEDERVLLKPLSIEDINHLETYSLNEPDLWKYSLQQASGLDNLTKYIGKAIEGRSNLHSYPWIVYDKATKEYAGSTRFYDYQEIHQTVQLGFTWYGKKFHGSGLNQHCKYLMLQFAFDQLRLKRVEFRADNNNARSIAAMKSIGATVEGILRSNCQGITDRRDSIILSILADEWNDKVKAQLELKIGKQK